MHGREGHTRPQAERLNPALPPGRLLPRVTRSHSVAPARSFARRRPACCRLCKARSRGPCRLRLRRRPLPAPARVGRMRVAARAQRRAAPLRCTSCARRWWRRGARPTAHAPPPSGSTTRACATPRRLGVALCSRAWRERAPGRSRADARRARVPCHAVLASRLRACRCRWPGRCGKTRLKSRSGCRGSPPSPCEPRNAAASLLRER